MANKMSINWETAMPASGLKPSSIYIIDPGVGNKPQVFVTNKLGSQSYQINPNQDLSAFIKTINGLAPDGNGAVTMNLTFVNGVLSMTGSGVNFDLDARYVELADFTPWKNTTDNRITSLESAMTEGLKTPVPFDSSANPTFPSQTKGFTYKVITAGTTAGVALEVGDTIIYDTTGNTPFVVQSNLGDATTTVKGIIAIATQAEVDAGSVNNKAIVPATLTTRLAGWLTATTASQAEVDAGTINNKFVTPLTNKTNFDNRKATQAEVNTGTLDTKYVTPLTNKANFDSRKATQTEVNTGTNDTQFVTPLTLQTKISTALSSVHTHSNKAILDKIGESGTGEMLYNGDAVYTLGNNAW